MRGIHRVVIQSAHLKYELEGAEIALYKNTGSGYKYVGRGVTDSNGELSFGNLEYSVNGYTAIEISIPERDIVIEEPYQENDRSKSVCVTFLRDAEKVWVDPDPQNTKANMLRHKDPRRRATFCGGLPIYGGSPFGLVAAVIPVYPLANVIRNHTCHDGDQFCFGRSLRPDH